MLISAEEFEKYTPTLLPIGLFIKLAGNYSYYYFDKSRGIKLDKLLKDAENCTYDRADFMDICKHQFKDTIAECDFEALELDLDFLYTFWYLKAIDNLDHKMTRDEIAENKRTEKLSDKEYSWLAEDILRRSSDKFHEELAYKYLVDKYHYDILEEFESYHIREEVSDALSRLLFPEKALPHFLKFAERISYDEFLFIYNYWVRHRYTNRTHYIHEDGSCY